LGVALQAAEPGFPFQDEALHYTVGWPSGLPLGEASFTAHRTQSGWEFSADLNAGIPGFAVADKSRSVASADLCSAEFERDFTRGPKKSREKTTFDQGTGIATRVTLVPKDGGKSDIPIPSCARDALTFLYHVRRELGQGRVPPQQQIFYGAGYFVRLEYAGSQTLTVAEKKTLTDHLVVHVRGPESNLKFDAFFARDAARTPVSIKVPFATATFSMDLAP
jgi:hypothetical protein